MEMDALALLKGFQVHHLAAVEPGFLRGQGDEVAFLEMLLNDAEPNERTTTLEHSMESPFIA